MERTPVVDGFSIVRPMRSHPSVVAPNAIRKAATPLIIRDGVPVCVIHEATANKMNRDSGKEQTERGDCGAPLAEKPGKQARNPREAIDPPINEPPLEPKIAVLRSSILERRCCRQIEIWNTI